LTIATNADTIGTMDTDSRIDAYPWPIISKDLDAHGWAMIKRLLTTTECEAIAGLYLDDHHFRSHIVMAQHGFGRGVVFAVCNRPSRGRATRPGLDRLQGLVRRP